MEVTEENGELVLEIQQPNRKRSRTPLKKELEYDSIPENLPTLQELYDSNNNAWLTAQRLISPETLLRLQDPAAIMAQIENEAQRLEAFIKNDDEKNYDPVAVQLAKKLLQRDNHLSYFWKAFTTQQEVDAERKKLKARTNFNVLQHTDQLRKKEAALEKQKDQGTVEKQNQIKGQLKYVKEELAKYHELEKLTYALNGHKKSTETYAKPSGKWPGEPDNIVLFFQDLPDEMDDIVEIEQPFKPPDDPDELLRNINQMADGTKGPTPKKKLALRIYDQITPYLKGIKQPIDLSLKDDSQLSLVKNDALLLKPLTHNGKYLVSEQGKVLLDQIRPRSAGYEVTSYFLNNVLNQLTALGLGTGKVTKDELQEIHDGLNEMLKPPKPVNFDRYPEDVSGSEASEFVPSETDNHIGDNLKSDADKQKEYFTLLNSLPKIEEDLNIIQAELEKTNYSRDEVQSWPADKQNEWLTNRLTLAPKERQLLNQRAEIEQQIKHIKDNYPILDTEEFSVAIKEQISSIIDQLKEAGQLDLWDKTLTELRLKPSNDDAPKTATPPIVQDSSRGAVASRVPIAAALDQLAPSVIASPEPSMIVTDAPSQLAPSMELTEETRRLMNAGNAILNLLQDTYQINVSSVPELPATIDALISRLIQERDVIENQRIEIQTLLEVERHRVGEVEQAYQELINTNNILNNELRNANNLYNNTVAAASNQHTEHEAEIEQWNEEKRGLQNQIAIADQELINLRARIEELNEQLTNQSQQMNNQNQPPEPVEQLDFEIQTITEPPAPGHHKDIQVRGTVNELPALFASINRLGEENRRNQKTINELEQENQRSKSLIADLRRESLDMKRIRRDDAHAQNNLYKNFLAKTTKENTKLRNINKELVAQMNARLTGRIWEENRGVEGERIIHQLNERIKHLQKERAQYVERFQQLNNQLDNVQSSHDGLQAENITLQEKTDTLQRTIDDNLKSIEEYKNLNAAFKITNNELINTQKTLNNLRQNYANAANSVVTMLGDYEGKSNDVLVNLNDMIQDLVQANASLRTKNAQLTEEGQALTAQYHVKLEQQQEEHERAMNNLRERYNQETATLVAPLNKNYQDALQYWSNKDDIREKDKQREINKLQQDIATETKKLEDKYQRALDAQYLQDKEERRILELEYEDNLAALQERLDAHESALVLPDNKKGYYDQDIQEMRHFLTYFNQLLATEAARNLPYLQELYHIFTDDIKHRLEDRRKQAMENYRYDREAQVRSSKQAYDEGRTIYKTEAEQAIRTANHKHEKDMYELRVQTNREEGKQLSINAIEARAARNKFLFNLIGKLAGTNDPVAMSHGYALLAKFSEALLDLPDNELNTPDVRQYLNMYDNGALDRLVSSLAQPKQPVVDDALSKRITDLEGTVRSFINITAQRTAHVGAAQAYHPPRRVFVGREGVPHQGNRYARGYRSNRRLPPRRPDGRFKRVSSPVRKHKK